MTHAFEFRDPQCFIPSVRGVLEQSHPTLCVFDMPDLECQLCATSGTVYARLHGPGVVYGGLYGVDGLENWVRRIRAWRSEDRPTRQSGVWTRPRCGRPGPFCQESAGRCTRLRFAAGPCKTPSRGFDSHRRLPRLSDQHSAVSVQPVGPQRLRRNPPEILKRRYAQGEITKQQFEQMEKDLGVD